MIRPGSHRPDRITTLTSGVIIRVITWVVIWVTRPDYHARSPPAAAPAPTRAAKAGTKAAAMKTTKAAMEAASAVETAATMETTAETAMPASALSIGRR